MLSLDDLMELLKSVDHDKIVTHDTAQGHHVMSDSALETLLDRASPNNGGGVSSGRGNGNDLFRVIEEGSDGSHGLQSVNMEEAKMVKSEETEKTDLSQTSPLVDSDPLEGSHDPASIQDSGIISKLSKVLEE